MKSAILREGMWFAANRAKYEHDQEFEIWAKHGASRLHVSDRENVDNLIKVLKQVRAQLPHDQWPRPLLPAKQTPTLPKGHAPAAPATVKRLLGAAPEPMRTFLALLVTTGLRAGEAAALRWRDVRPDGQITVKSKGDRSRTIRLPPELHVDIEALRAKRPKRTRPGVCRVHVFGATSSCPHRSVLAAASVSTARAGIHLRTLRATWISSVLRQPVPFLEGETSDLGDVFARYGAKADHTTIQKKRVPAQRTKRRRE